jgi:hypothetical protein
MEAPVQFSIRRMMAAVTLFCLAMGLSTLIWRYGGEQHDFVSLVEVIAAAMMLGCATGLILGDSATFTIPGAQSWCSAAGWHRLVLRRRY